jgi:hypothetical protein
MTGHNDRRPLMIFSPFPRFSFFSHVHEHTSIDVLYFLVKGTSINRTLEYNLIVKRGSWFDYQFTMGTHSSVVPTDMIWIVTESVGYRIIFDLCCGCNPRFACLSIADRQADLVSRRQCLGCVAQRSTGPRTELRDPSSGAPFTRCRNWICLADAPGD